MPPVLAAALAALLSAPPLDCPPGTRLQGGAPPDQLEAWCEGHSDASGRPRRHGPARSWYDDGAVRIEERWQEGRRDGPFVEFHRNGRRARQGAYQRDDKVGTWTIWYEDGGLEERSEYLRNVPNGPFTSWFRNGKKRAEGQHCLGAQCGRWITYDEGGREVGRVDFGEQRATP